MRKKERVGTLVKFRGGYGVGVCKAIRKKILFLVEPPLKWVMIEGLSFGWKDGVRRSSCVFPFFLCVHWLCQRRPR